MPLFLFLEDSLPEVVQTVQDVILIGYYLGADRIFLVKLPLKLQLV